MEMSPGFEIPGDSLAWLAKFPAHTCMCTHTHTHTYTHPLPLQQDMVRESEHFVWAIASLVFQTQDHLLGWPAVLPRRGRSPVFSVLP